MKMIWRRKKKMKKLWKQGLTMAMAAMMATAVPVSGLMGPMTAMASPMNNNSDEIVTKSISKGKIGRSMNINFVVRNESGGDWENVVVGIEEQDFTMSKPDAIDGDYVFPFEITENNNAGNCAGRKREKCFFDSQSEG